MSTELSEHKYQELKKQYEYIAERIYTSELGHFPRKDSLKSILEKVDEELEEVERRKKSFESTNSEEIYKRFLSKLDLVDSNIESLQQSLVYLDTYESQKETWSERLEYTTSVCEELSDPLQIEVDTLPIVWDGYATFDIVSKDFYAIHLPRDKSKEKNSPIIAHELGHAVQDHLDTRNEGFVEKLQELRQDFSDDMVGRTFFDSWRNWFDELFCDACGFYTFGMAYLSASIHRLYNQTPYEMPNAGSVSHYPPDVLRYRFIDRLAQDNLPDELYELSKKEREEYEEHLGLLGSRSDGRLDDWVDERLLNEIDVMAMENIESDLDALCDDILSEKDPKEVPQRRHRIEANMAWLD